MKCYNFLCERHNPEMDDKCGSLYIIPAECETQKRFNRIMKNTILGKIPNFKKERDKYWGRGDK